MKKGKKYVLQKVAKYTGTIVLSTLLLAYPSSSTYATIEYTSEDDGTSVKSLLESAKKCLGEMFTGYKGGSFLMEVDTPIWVSNYGETSQMRLADIEVLSDNWVYLKCVEVKD